MFVRWRFGVFEASKAKLLLLSLSIDLAIKAFNLASSSFRRRFLSLSSPIRLQTTFSFVLRSTSLVI